MDTTTTRARRGPRRESGMTTSEYAVGTVGACGLAAVLVHLGGDDWFLEMVKDVLTRALDPRSLIDLFGGPRRGIGLR